MRNLPSDFRDGVRDAVPIQVGLIPYGLVVGVAAVRVGLTAAQGVGFSAAVFAGASQLAAIDLLANGAPLAVVVLTATVINLRIMLFSASLAPYLQKYRFGYRVLFSTVLVGMAYARSIAEFQDRDDLDHGWYFFGVALSLYAVWIVTTVAGVLLGTGIPSNLDITFIVPLIFLSMAVSSVKGRPTLAAAVVGSLAAMALAGLPMRLNLVVAGVVGVTAGLLADRYAEGEP
jgi:4-azaleucine resistance transporter AzlC